MVTAVIEQDGRVKTYEGQLIVVGVISDVNETDQLVSVGIKGEASAYAIYALGCQIAARIADSTRCTTTSPSDEMRY